jgi:hypothetical protein
VIERAGIEIESVPRPRRGSRAAALALGAAVFLLVAPGTAAACAVCFGNPDSPHTQGMQNAILFLLAVIGGVLVALAAFFIHLTRKARAHREALPAGGRLAARLGSPRAPGGRNGASW